MGVPTKAKNHFVDQRVPNETLCTKSVTATVTAPESLSVRSAMAFAWFMLAYVLTTTTWFMVWPALTASGIRLQLSDVLGGLSLLVALATFALVMRQVGIAEAQTSIAKTQAELAKTELAIIQKQDEWMRQTEVLDLGFAQSDQFWKEHDAIFRYSDNPFLADDDVTCYVPASIRNTGKSVQGVNVTLWITERPNQSRLTPLHFRHIDSEPEMGKGGFVIMRHQYVRKYPNAHLPGNGQLTQLDTWGFTFSPQESTYKIRYRLQSSGGDFPTWDDPFLTIYTREARDGE